MTPLNVKLNKVMFAKNLLLPFYEKNTFWCYVGHDSSQIIAELINNKKSKLLERRKEAKANMF